MCGENKNKNEGKEGSLSPEEKASVLSRILFWWLNPLLRQGRKQDLETTDLYVVAKNDSSVYLCDRLEKYWKLELQKLQQGKRPSLRVALWKTFGVSYMIWGFVALVIETLRIVQPVLLGGLIRFFSAGSGVELWEGYLYAMGVSLCSIIPAVCFHVYSLNVLRYGMWMRVAICSLVYKKCLRLSSRALGETSVGQIVNLTSNDAQKLDNSVLVGHYLLIGPLQMVAVGVILWYKIYWAVLAGMAVLILMLPMSGILGRIFGKLRSRIAVHTDERVRLTNEMLNAMRIVKMYCWEKLFKGLIDSARVHETATIMKASYAKAMAMAPFFYSSKLIAYFTFLTYILTGNKLTAEVVFVTLSLYTPVRLAITFYLPLGAQVGSEALTTIGRMQEFLLKEERLANRCLVGDSKMSKNPTVTVSSITASWDEDSVNAILRDVSFDVSRGELLIVIGAVGTGKSSLLMAILGELALKSGDVQLNGKLAYVSQQAWVFGSSVRENILFGEPYDAAKYGRIVEAAALKRDFELMAEGDQTLVGDRGVSLSGGQKARISLARALYQGAELYLLDDPLSAVDAHVSNHIFHKCICGHLKNKARILVTHQLQYLKSADKILVLSSDRSARIGTFSELSQGGVDFTELIKSELSETAHPPPPSFDGTEARFRGSNEVAEDGNRAASKTNSDHQNMNSLGIRDRSEFAGKNFSKLPKTVFLSRSYANVYDDLDKEFKSTKPLLSRSTDLAKTLDRSQRAGTRASLADAVSLSAFDQVEEYVPQTQAEESRATGTVGGRLYLQFFYLGGGVLGLVIFAFLNLAAQISFIMADWWLAYWCSSIEAYERKMLPLLTRNDTFLNVTGDVTITMETAEPLTTTTTVSIGNDVDNTNSTPIQFPHTVEYLYIFSGITGAVVVFAILRAIHSFHIVVQASKALHARMLSAILRCPIGFFDLNPIGRILNRFSKDLGQVDEVLPFVMYDFIQVLLLVLAVFLVVGIMNPWVFIGVVPIFVVIALLRRYFLGTVRSIKRLEATTKSPVFSHISSTLLGVHTIRACGAEDAFVRDFYRHQDVHTSAYFLFTALVRWFALRLDTICAVFIAVVAFCAVFAAQSMNGSLVGLSLNYAMTLMMLFQWGVRQSSEVESLMTSVERIVEYAKLPSEAPLESSDDHKPPSDWPKDGRIAGRNVCLKYKEDGANVLDDLSFSIDSSEKIGIVGRTGAGKSSLISLLFRLVEPGGLLSIDDLVITNLGLHDLREKISIIPQDPVLLTASVRKNLDPLDSCSDFEIWRSLKQVEMQQVVEEMPSGLDSLIQEGGANLSMGQRQLICLARAILKCNKILVIDEATANVDPRTDALIQATIRDQFADCTVLTIAHRLNTIIDSDRVMVLDAGRIIEFDRPHNLLQNTGGHFYKMAEQTGPVEFQRLKQQAADASVTTTTTTTTTATTTRGNAAASSSAADVGNGS